MLKRGRNRQTLDRGLGVGLVVSGFKRERGRTAERVGVDGRGKQDRDRKLNPKWHPNTERAGYRCFE